MGHRHTAARSFGASELLAPFGGVAAPAREDFLPASASPFAESHADVNPAPGIAARVLLCAVHGYRILLSPVLGGACRFYPSCSNYASEAVARHGARRGMWLSLRRLLRCRPFSTGGFDPVPDARERRA